MKHRLHASLYLQLSAHNPLHNTTNTKMTTIPARLAKMSTTSGTFEEARKRSLSLYRDWYRAVSSFLFPHFHSSPHTNSLDFSRQAPQICALYALNISPSMIRMKKRADFEKHRHIQDLNVIDLLLFKSHQDYQETMNCWKQEVSAKRPVW
jgi:NADH dehydrogenase (ubiquinone) 1 alpha subcomplex subunit 6